jgi:trimeric autotransporter adhesin
MRTDLRLRLCMMVPLLLFVVVTRGQVTPQYYNNAGGTAYNNFPLNSTTSNKVQWIYGPNVFSTSGSAGTPAPVGQITKLWFRLGNTVSATATYTDFTLSLGQSSGTNNTFLSGSFLTGLTQVFYQPSFTMTGAAAASWYSVILQTPFPYNPNQSLVFELKVSGGTGNQVAQVVTTAMDQKIYGGYAASAGLPAPGLLDFGMDIQVAGPCTAPPNAGIVTVSTHMPCLNQNFFLNLSGNSVGFGQTYIWQSASNISGPFTNVAPADTVSSLSTNALQNGKRYYRAIITCNNQSDTSNVDSVIVPTVFAAGTYTINAAMPTLGTNFHSFTDAVNAISCGISGPVTFNVAVNSGPYNEQIVLPATIGATATNTVIFNGNGNVLASTGNPGNYATLSMNGADYISVNNLVINANNVANGFGIHLSNNADYNIFDSCTVNASMTSLSLGSVGIVMSASDTAYNVGGSNGSHNSFSYCTVNGGYLSVAFYGSLSATNTGNSLVHCAFRDFFQYGSFNIYQTNLLVGNSVFERPVRPSVGPFYGLMLSNGCSNSTVEKNTFRSMAGSTANTAVSAYVIFSNAVASLNNENKIFNNRIYNTNINGSIDGIYLVGAEHVKVYHNTVSLDNAAATSGICTGIYSSGSAGIDIRNNNISLTQGSTLKYGLNFVGGGKISNHNNIYLAGGLSNFVGRYISNYATLANWQTANSGMWDQASLSLDPLFNNITTGNLTPTSIAMDNLGTPVGISTDITGATRSATTPDIGAFEMITCPAPSNLLSSVTGTSVVLDWMENGTATQWQIEYGIGNFSPGSGTIVSTSIKPYTLSGLNSASSYTYYVRSACGANDTSSWSAVNSFTTSPANNGCANALMMQPGQSFSGSTTGATGSMPPGTCVSGSTVANDVWYYFITTGAGTQTVSATDTSANIVLEIYNGSCTALTEIGCVNATTIGTETLTLLNLPADTYYVRIYGYQGATLNFNMQNAFYLAVADVNAPSGMQLIVSPNPATDRLSLTIEGSRGEHGSVILSDLQGRVVKTEEMITDNIQWDITSLPLGIYLLKYSDSKHSCIRKFVKK